MITHKSPKYKSNLTYVSSPIRLKDGVYIGDKSSFKDTNFIGSNKVSHIIMVNSEENDKTAKVYSQDGLSYLSVSLVSIEMNVPPNKIFNFIEEAAENGESVLICSQNGKSLAQDIGIVYFMRKYRWGLQKCFSFMERIVGPWDENARKHIEGKKKNNTNRKETLEGLQVIESIIEGIEKGKRMSVLWGDDGIDGEIEIANMYKNSTAVEIDDRKATTSKKRVSWIADLKLPKSDQSEFIPKDRNEENFQLKSILKYSELSYPESPTKSLEDVKVTEIPLPQSLPNKAIKSLKVSHLRLSANNYFSVDSTSQCSLTTPVYNSKNLNFQSPSSQTNTPTQESFVKTISPVTRIRSESKGQERRIENRSGCKLVPYQNIISSIKSPYDRPTLPLTRPIANLFPSNSESNFRSYQLQQQQTSTSFPSKENPSNKKLNWKPMNSRTTANIMKLYNSNDGIGGDRK